MRSAWAPAGATAWRPIRGAPGASAPIAASRSPEMSAWPRPESASATSRGRPISRPSGRRARDQFISRIEPLSFRVESNHGADRGAPLPAQIIDSDLGAHARQAVLDEPERNRAAESRAHGARGHVAERLPRAACALDKMCAGRQRRFAAPDAEADQLLAASAPGGGREQRPLADILVLSLLARTGDAEILRHGRPIGVLADDDVALFGAQDHQRFQPHEPTAEGRQLFDDRGAQPPRAACGNGELIGTVAGEAHARDPERPSIERARGEGHVRQAFVVERDAEVEGRDEITRAGTGEGERRPLRRRIVDDDAARIEAVLPPELEPHDDRVRVSRRAGDEKTVVGEAQGYAVVEHEAALRQQKAVADPARLEGGQAVIAVEVGEPARV